VRPRKRRSLHVIVATALALLLVAALPGHANADPTTPSEVEAQLQALWEKAEPLIEEYNGIHEQYQANLVKQAAMVRQIEPLQRQIDLGQLKIGAIAAKAYRGGQARAFNAVLASGSPEHLADQMELLEFLAHQQQEELQGVTDLKAVYDAQKAPIDRLVATLAAQDADLADRKKTIEAQLVQLQKLRRQAYGSNGGTGSYRPWPCPAQWEATKGYKVASFACKQAGKPYVWAAAGPGSYDCSGLVLAAWKQVGVYLPHQSRSQRASVPYVSRANLRIGDLVFYYNPIHHVGIYVGDNKIMHAPSAGDHVRMADMDRAGPINSFGRPR
jgi:cell wall-associated NlpC family hydrolase